MPTLTAEQLQELMAQVFKHLTKRDTPSTFPKDELQTAVMELDAWLESSDPRSALSGNPATNATDADIWGALYVICRARYQIALEGN